MRSTSKLSIEFYDRDVETKDVITALQRDGAVVVDTIRRDGFAKGFDALRREYVDMVAAGIIDPTQVARSALQNAASIS